MSGWPRRRVLAGVLLGMLLQGLLEAPASLLAGLLNRAALPVRASAPSGTLWSGSLDLAWWPPATNAAATVPAAPATSPPAPADGWPLGRWAWHLTWQGLAGPGLRVATLTGPLALQASLWPGWHRLRCTDLQASLPASALPAGWSLWDLLRGEGSLTLQAAALRLDDTGLTGAGSLRWQDASIAQSPVHPLGSWEVAFEAGGAQGHYRLRTLAGPLQLDGQGRFALDGRFSLEGRATADAPAQGALAPLLALLGTPAADGSSVLALPWPAEAHGTVR